MPEVKKDQSAGKRQQIYKSGRTMFAWVAGASVIAGFAVMVAGFGQRGFVAGERLGALAQVTQGVALIDERLGVIRLLRQCLRVAVQRLAGAAQQAQGDAQVIQQRSRRLLERARFFKALQSLRRLAPLQVQLAQQVQRVKVLRIVLQQLFQQGHGALALPLAQEVEGVLQAQRGSDGGAQVQHLGVAGGAVFGRAHGRLS